MINIQTLVIGCLLISAYSKALALDVQGHRGARTELPENSLAAFEYAVTIGVDTLELDTGVTKDGVVVIYHDQTINRQLCQYTDGRQIKAELWIHELTFADLQDFDCGSKVNQRFTKQRLIPNTRIPSLRALLDWLKKSELERARTVRLNIETKSNPRKPHAQPRPVVFADAILDLLDEFEVTHRAMLQSFDHRTLVAAKKRQPTIKTAALFYDNLNDWVTPTLAADADIVSPNHKHLTTEEVEAIHAAGLKVIPWTANQVDQWRKLIDMGVDGIITDDPKRLLKLLNRYKERPN